MRSKTYKALSLLASEETQLYIWYGIYLPDLTRLQQGRVTEVPRKSQGESGASRTLLPPRYLKLDESLVPGLVYLTPNAAGTRSEPGGGFPSSSLLGMGCSTG